MGKYQGYRDDKIKQCSARMGQIDRGETKYFKGEKPFRVAYETAHYATPEKLKAAQDWTAFVLKEKDKIKKRDDDRRAKIAQKGVKRDEKGHLLPGSCLNPSGVGGVKGTMLREIIKNSMLTPDEDGKYRIVHIVDTLYKTAVEGGTQSVSAATLLLAYSIGRPQPQEEEIEMNKVDNKIMVFLPLRKGEDPSKVNATLETAEVITEKKG